MSLEAIKTICAYEEEARRIKHITLQNAQQSIESVRQAGEEGVARSIARAEVEIAHLMRASDHKATEQALELAEKTANRQATLRARAERRLDDAVKLITERIVKT